MLTSKEIETKSFSKARAGYDPEEVDNFLDEILEDYDRFVEEKANLERKIGVLNQTIANLKKERTSSDHQMVSSNLIESAQVKAEKLVNDAQNYAKKLIEAAKVEADNQEQRTARLNKEVSDFKSNLLSIYENHVKLISSIPEIKGFAAESSESLELLKSATIDVPETAEESPVSPIAEEPAKVEEGEDVFGDILFDTVESAEPEAEEDPELQFIEDEPADLTEPEEDEDDVKIRKATEAKGRRMKAEKKPEPDDDEDYIDFEDFDDEDEKGSAFGSLFGGKKSKEKEKEKKKKKHSFFSAVDEDEFDDDDDFDDDDF